MNLLKFIQKTIENGGASYNPEYGTQPENGYMVSIKDVSTISSLDLIEDEIQKIVLSNASMFLEKDIYMGSWIDDGKIYIDISKNVQEIKSAIRLGMLNDQLAIYDLNNGRDIKLKARQKSGTETQKATYLKLAIDKTIKEYK